MFKNVSDIQEFYELTLLDETKSIQQKTAETIRIANKWEASDGPITPTFAQNDVSLILFVYWKIMPFRIIGLQYITKILLIMLFSSWHSLVRTTVSTYVLYTWNKKPEECSIHPYSKHFHSLSLPIFISEETTLIWILTYILKQEKVKSEIG